MHDFRHTFEFPAIKIWKYKSKIAELEQNNNPFALIVLGFIKNLDEKDLNKKRDAMEAAFDFKTMADLENWLKTNAPVSKSEEKLA